MSDAAIQDNLVSPGKESDLIAAISAAPCQRSAFVAAAEYFDIVGQEETASSLHNGVVPAWLVDKYQLEKYPSEASGRLASCDSLAWYPAHSEKLIKPLNTDSNRNSVFERSVKECPHEVLNILHDGALVYDGMNRLFIDPLNTRISNHSDVNSYLAHRLAGDINQSENVLEGLSIMLAARNSGNFYHWHFDILPALGLVEECGIAISQIDNIILTEKENSFHLPMLKRLGVCDRQLKIIKPGYDVVRCEKLLLPTIRCNMGMRQPRKHIDWLRFKYLESCTEKFDDKNSIKLAIVRDRRGYTDSQLVIDFLEKKGYKPFMPEKYSYAEQVKMFQNASHVVAPHGAALALLAYCRPGTVVHEFYGEHIHPCFWSIASTLGLKYYNYNCSEISQAEVTNSGRGMVNRLNKSIDVTEALLHSMDSL